MVPGGAEIPPAGVENQPHLKKRGIGTTRLSLRSGLSNRVALHAHRNARNNMPRRRATPAHGQPYIMYLRANIKENGLAYCVSSLKHRGMREILLRGEAGGDIFYMVGNRR